MAPPYSQFEEEVSALTPVVVEAPPELEARKEKRFSDHEVEPPTFVPPPPSPAPEMVPQYEPEMVPQPEPEVVPQPEPEVVHGHAPEVVEQHAPEAVPSGMPEAPAQVDDANVRRASFDLEAGRPLGVVFSESGMPEPNGSLVVTSIAEDSPFCKPTSGRRGVRPGDLLIEVNGKGGDRKIILERLQRARKKGGRLDVMVRIRPSVFEVHLRKESADQKMGFIVIVHDDIPDRLEVQRLSEQGGIPSWNEDHPLLQVATGDWITAVNGNRSGASQMIEVMQSAWVKEGNVQLEFAADSGSGGS